LGLPLAWTTVLAWLISTFPKETPEKPVWERKPLLCPEIPQLADYDGPATDEFWKIFPSRVLPRNISTPIRVNRLKVLLRRKSKNFSAFQRLVAKRAIKNFEFGAITATKRHLPSLRAKNAGSSLIHGREVTDTIASWVKNGHLAGPFVFPPLTNFRCNPLMALYSLTRLGQC
jgi:hypothetical protein